MNTRTTFLTLCTLLLASGILTATESVALKKARSDAAVTVNSLITQMRGWFDIDFTNQNECQKLLKNLKELTTAAVLHDALQSHETVSGSLALFSARGTKFTLKVQKNQFLESDVRLTNITITQLLIPGSGSDKHQTQLTGVLNALRSNLTTEQQRDLSVLTAIYAPGYNATPANNLLDKIPDATLSEKWAIKAARRIGYAAHNPDEKIKTVNLNTPNQKSDMLQWFQPTKKDLRAINTYCGDLATAGSLATYKSPFTQALAAAACNGFFCSLRHPNAYARAQGEPLPLPDKREKYLQTQAACRPFPRIDGE
jgi:hypothetical protein